MPAQHILDVRPVEVGLRQVWIELYCLVIVIQGIDPTAHLNEIGCPVVVSKHIFRIDVNDPIHVGQSSIEISDLRIDEASVVQGEGISRLVFQDSVEIGNG